MKFFKVLSLVGIYTLALNAHATNNLDLNLAGISYDMGMSTNNPIISSTAPFIYAGNCISQIGGAQQWEGGEYNCVFATTTGITITLSSVVLLKEEVVQVERDAYAFLAGEEMTLALEQVVEKAKNEVPSYSKMNNEEVIAHLMAIKDIQL